MPISACCKRFSGTGAGDEALRRRQSSISGEGCAGFGDASWASPTAVRCRAPVLSPAWAQLCSRSDARRRRSRVQEAAIAVAEGATVVGNCHGRHRWIAEAWMSARHGRTPGSDVAARGFESVMKTHLGDLSKVECGRGWCNRQRMRAAGQQKWNKQERCKQGWGNSLHCCWFLSLVRRETRQRADTGMWKLVLRHI